MIHCGVLVPTEELQADEEYANHERNLNGAARSRKMLSQAIDGFVVLLECHLTTRDYVQIIM